MPENHSSSLQVRQIPDTKRQAPVYTTSEQANIFPEERKGWRGYVEWEKYPEKKKEAAKILASYNFQQVRFDRLLSLTEWVDEIIGSRISIQATTGNQSGVGRA